MHDFATVAEDALPIGVKAADAQLASAQFLAAHDAWQRPLLKGDDLAVQRRHGEKLPECLHLSARFLLVRETVLLNRGLVPVQDLAIQCGNHHALGEVLHDDGQLCFAQSHCLLGPLALGDVAHMEEHGGLAGKCDPGAGDFHRHGTAIRRPAESFYFCKLASRQL